jgi:hypothetical protein
MYQSAGLLPPLKGGTLNFKNILFENSEVAKSLR